MMKWLGVAEKIEKLESFNSKREVGENLTKLERYLLKDPNEVGNIKPRCIALFQSYIKYTFELHFQLLDFSKLEIPTTRLPLT